MRTSSTKLQVLLQHNIILQHATYFLTKGTQSGFGGTYSVYQNDWSGLEVDYIHK